MKALLCINEKSGAVQNIGAQAIEDAAAARFNDRDGCSLEVAAGEFQEFMAAVQDAINNQSADIVIAAGGDGTQAAIAGALMSSEIALAPLPCGTVNELCRDLSIPLDLEEALDAIKSGPSRRIDVGCIDDKIFLNNIVFGAYAELAESRETLRDATTVDEVSLGVVGAADALFHADPLKFKLEIDGRDIEVTTNTIVVSNNTISHAEKLIPQRARLDEGCLAVYLAEARHGGDFAALLAEFAATGAREADSVDILKCRTCIVSSEEERFSYTIDGDPVESDKPVKIIIKEKALKVIAP